MLTLLFYLLISLSNKHLQSLTLTQPKTLSHGFSLDLIHRYSLKSPFYNSSMTLRERYHSLALHSSSRHQHFNYLQAKASNFVTSLIPQNGDYLMKIAVGVPPVDLFVILDTSSDLMWIQCKPCDRCNKQSREMFDPNQSSAYETISCDSPFCPHIPQMQCDSFTNECQYWHTYGSRSSLTSGVMARDLFTLGTINSTFIFGCSLQEDEGFNPNAAGYIGLNGAQFSLISQLGVSNQFSYCLTPTNSNFTSKLRLGSHVIPRSQGAITTPLWARYLPSFYVITLTGVSIGHATLNTDRSIFIDTSSTFTYLDPSIYSGIEDAVRDAVGVEPIVRPPQPELSLCYDKKSGINTGPANMVFHFEGGEISLTSINMFIDLGDVLCLAIVPSEEDGDSMILGNVAQVNFEVEYDLDSRMVTFTPTNCYY
ncbi:aspartic proteinase CDR1-like [Silene latifolia]|uniref:aspartic proteinase CDR1-like n=1 Tax=Silene latifolia TaxID=37657 RepID=UPI003D772295